MMVKFSYAPVSREASQFYVLGVFVWTGENDPKTLHVQANFFWKRRKNLRVK